MIDLLAIHWHMNPDIIHIGGFVLRWYSVLFLAGFVLGWFIFKGFLKREGLPLSLLDPLLFTLLVATIVGARLGHCIFYEPDYYFGSWQGALERRSGKSRRYDSDYPGHVVVCAPLWTQI